jgi:hypothetical protein
MIATVNLLARPGPDGCWGVAAARAEQRRAKEARIPLHRFTAPEEVAKAVLCLASPAANFISGVSLPLDGGMHATIIQEQEALGVQIRQLQTEALPADRLHGAIDIEPLEHMVHAPDGLHAACGEAPTSDRQEVKSAFVLATYPDGADVHGGDRPLEVGPTGDLEDRNRLRVFLRAWVGLPSAWP